MPGLKYSFLLIENPPASLSRSFSRAKPDGQGIKRSPCVVTGTVHGKAWLLDDPVRSSPLFVLTQKEAKKSRLPGKSLNATASHTVAAQAAHCVRFRIALGVFNLAFLRLCQEVGSKKRTIGRDRATLGRNCVNCAIEER